jgi:hypothetical protein
MLLTSDEFASYADGNIGAMSFLEELMNYPKYQVILDALKKAPTIVGWQLWTLYSDLAEKNMDTVYNLCLNTRLKY